MHVSSYCCSLNVKLKFQESNKASRFTKKDISFNFFERETQKGQAPTAYILKGKKSNEKLDNKEKRKKNKRGKEK